MSGLPLIGALERELRGAAKALGVRGPSRGEIVRAGSTPVALMRSGVGAPGARSAAEAIARERPAVVLHVGFAGGLRAGLVEGDLLVVTAVIDGGTLHLCADTDALRSALARLPVRLGQGALVTVPRFVHLPADKRALAASTQAAACDMEAAALARACAKHGVRYVGLRAISDGPDRRLLPSVDGAGSLRAQAKDLLSPATPWRAVTMLHGARRAEATLTLAIPTALAALGF
jgi:nucleoside phosphorylase